MFSDWSCMQGSFPRECLVRGFYLDRYDKSETVLLFLLSVGNFCLVYDFVHSKFQESCEKTTDLGEFLSDSVSTFSKNKNIWQKFVICITIKKLSLFCIITAKLMWWCKLLTRFLHSDICILTIPNLNISLGCGEHLVRTILARECSCALQTEDAHQALLETMQNKFIGKYMVLIA